MLGAYQKRELDSPVLELEIVESYLTWVFWKSSKHSYTSGRVSRLWLYFSTAVRKWSMTDMCK